MKIATAKSRQSKDWKTAEWTWEQFIDRLRYPKRTAETMAQYRAMSKDEQSKVKDVGGFVGGALDGGRRKAGAVVERWLVTLDADYNADVHNWTLLTVIWGLKCCVYSTHSHAPESPRLRWILPLNRAVTPDEYEAIARKVAAKFLDIEQMDPTTYQPERMMFWPSCSSDAEYVFLSNSNGEELNADDVLAEYGPGDAWRNTALWPVSSRETEVVRREALRQADPLTKDGIVGAFCRVYDVHDAIAAFDLPYEPVAGMPDRYTYTHGSTCGGAVVYEQGRWLYSNHATDPAGGQLCNAFDLVRIHKFGELDETSRAQDSTRLPSFQRMAELAAGDARVRDSIIESSFGDLGKIAPVSEGSGRVNTVKPESNTVISGDDDADEAENDGAWKAELTIDKKTGKPERTLNNACCILYHAPDFKGKLSYCKMGGLIYVTRPMPWVHTERGMTEEEEKWVMGGDWLTTSDIYRQKGYHGPPRMEGRVWDDQDRTELYKYFERLGYTVNQTHNGVLDNAILNTAFKASTDPIREYLLGLTWDGTKRLDEVFIRWLGAEDCPLNREITRLWMIGAVDRAIRPGCQFDSVLVFCGEQGIGKTKLLRMLAGEYYINSIQATSMDKSTAELLQGKWIVELGELDSVKKSASTAFKNFISSTADHYRKPYATNAETHPRQCVFAGTTNEGAFLRDDTGERRFWILPCAGQKGMAELGLKGTLPGFADEVEQIWAEATQAWRERIIKMRRNGERLTEVNLYLYLTDPALEAEMEARRGGFKLADTVREDVEDYLDRELPENWDDMSAEDRVDYIHGAWVGDPKKCTKKREEVTLKEIRTELYRERPEDAARSGRSQLVYRIASVMDSMPGWERVGRVNGGKSGRTVRWARTDSE